MYRKGQFYLAPNGQLLKTVPCFGWNFSRLGCASRNPKPKCNGVHLVAVSGRLWIDDCGWEIPKLNLKKLSKLERLVYLL